jgi:hypothetical protein
MKTPFDGVFLAIQTQGEEKLIKRYHSSKTHLGKYHEVVEV